MAAITRVSIAGSAAAYLPFLAKSQLTETHPVLELTVYASRVTDLDVRASRETALTILSLPTEES